MKLLSEAIKRHMGPNTFIIGLLMVYFMIWLSNIPRIAYFPTKKYTKLYHYNF